MRRAALLTYGISLTLIVSTAALAAAPAGQGCTLYTEDMEAGAPGWTHGVQGAAPAKAQKIADPPGPSTWHLASTTCRGGALGSTMFVSNGNDGAGCSPDSARDRSRLLGPPIALPQTGTIALEFDALSFDEGGTCLTSASYDRHDVGLTTDGGATYTRLNDCTALTDGAGTATHHSFDISAWAGQTVQPIFVYETVDSRDGHTFAVDNVTVTADACAEPLELVAGKSSVTHAWSTVAAQPSFQNPVVIAGPASRNGSDPGAIRLRNVGPSSFQARYAEWDYLDGTHFAAESFSWLVLPAGRHELADGSVWLVGTFELSGTDARMRVDFPQPFPGAPAVFLTAQTSNGNQTVTARVTSVTGSHFRAALFEEEGLMDGHVTETVGYLAVSRGPGYGRAPVGGVELPYLLQTAQVNQQFTPVLGFNIKLEEERSTDAETVHADETVDVLVLGAHLFAQDRTVAELDTVTIRRVDPDASVPMEWGLLRNVSSRDLVVPLSRAYTAPVVIVKPVSTRGADPGVLRLDAVQSDSFRLRYQEWAYLDGNHTEERVFYMVVESGSHTLGAGASPLTVEAGTLPSRRTAPAGGWHTIDLASEFTVAPAIFSAVQTFNGADPVTTRNRNASTTSFQATMQEEDGGDRAHFRTETLGWVAIEPGAGTTSNGRAFRVFGASAGDAPIPVGYGTVFNRRIPTVVVDISTRFGADACFPRFTTVSSSEITLYVQEEQSQDEEQAHLLEDLCIFAAE